ncbi:hypothetical protein [Nocardia colli]|nr:hypothetical protein [Nocardia colli]
MPDSESGVERQVRDYFAAKPRSLEIFTLLRGLIRAAYRSGSA